MRLIRTHKLIAASAAVAVLGAGGAVSIASASSGSSSTANATTGSLTVTVTGPRGKTHTRPTRQVRCAITNGDYVLTIGGRHRLRRGRATLSVPSYNGAGSYTGSLTIRVRALFTSLSKTVSVPVTMTSSGGSVTVSRTLPGKIHPSLRGKTVSATAAWTCMP
jgi:hypothetical protein